MTTNMTVVQRLTALQRRLIKAVHEMLPTHKACEHVRAADDEMRALPDRTVDKKGHDERIVAAQAHCIAAADFSVSTRPRHTSRAMCRPGRMIPEGF